MATKSKAAKAKSGKAKSKKSNGAAKPAKAAKKSTVDLAPAIAFAKTVSKEYGPVEVVRAVAAKFKSFKRGDVLSVAEALKINKYTASRQFHLLRSGEVKAEAA